MNRETNINTIKQVYADFGARNFKAVLDVLTDDIKWEPPLVPERPYNNLRTGKSEVEAWMKEMATDVTYTKEIPQAIYADNDVVIVKGFFAGMANTTGKSFESDFIHLWKFREDKICGYQAFWNTHGIVRYKKF